MRVWRVLDQVNLAALGVIPVRSEVSYRPVGVSLELSHSAGGGENLSWSDFPPSRKVLVCFLQGNRSKNHLQKHAKPLLLLGCGSNKETLCWGVSRRRRTQNRLKQAATRWNPSSPFAYMDSSYVPCLFSPGLLVLPVCLSLTEAVNTRGEALSQQQQQQ